MSSLNVIAKSDEAAFANLISFKVLDKFTKRPSVLDRRYMKIARNIVHPEELSDTSLDHQRSVGKSLSDKTKQSGLSIVHEANENEAGEQSCPEPLASKFKKLASQKVQ